MDDDNDNDGDVVVVVVWRLVRWMNSTCIVVVVVLPAIPPGLIVQLPAGNPFNTTDPVATVHVGCVMVPTVGAAGVDGCALITIFIVAGDVHPAALVTV